MTIDYKYHFMNWDNFVEWLLKQGFSRYESCMPCWRCYHKDSIIIEVSYYSHIPNRILKKDGYYPCPDGPCILSFNDPNEIPQEIIKEWAI